jgi:hypothetical protein
MVSASVYVALGGLAVTYAFVSFFILPMFSAQEKYLRQQPWVGVKGNGLFARFRAGMATIKNTSSMVQEGYQKVGNLNYSRMTGKADYLSSGEIPT